MKLPDYVWDYVSKLGVKHVFMFPGGGAMHLVDSLGKSDMNMLLCYTNRHVRWQKKLIPESIIIWGCACDNRTGWNKYQQVFRRVVGIYTYAYCLDSQNGRFERWLWSETAW